MKKIAPGDISRDVSFRTASLCFRLFCPETQIVDGKVVLFNSPYGTAGETQISDMRRSLSQGNHIDNFNYFEMEGVFFEELNAEYIQDRDDYLAYLANAMEDSWLAWLNFCYPDREFETYVSDENFIHVGFRELGP